MEVKPPVAAMRTVVESIVHRPVPQEHHQQRQQSPPKRKRSPSPSDSPPRRPPHRRLLPPSSLPDIDPQRALERERQLQEQEEQRDKKQAEKKPFDAKAEYERLMNARSGGVYVPPARLRALQAQFTDKHSKEYQRMAWEALKKSINGLINKVPVLLLDVSRC
jgi:pre-mRNA-splicing factor CWC22